MNQLIENELKSRGAKLIRFVDISHLDEKQNRRFPNAVVFVLPLTAEYVEMVSETPDYVQSRIDNNYDFGDDEYTQTENKAGEIADALARFITERGYRAVSQSDTQLLADDLFDMETKRSVLPHKTVALLGGLGWIGKNNLLITPEYGAAQCLGTVLTDAPLETVLYEPRRPECGNCVACARICERKVLKGTRWDRCVSRDEMVDIAGCSTCLKCLVHCPATKRYRKRNTE